MKRALPFTPVRDNNPPSLREKPLGKRGNEANLNKEANYGFSGSKDYQGVMKRCRPPKARKEPSSMERGQAKYEGIRKQREIPQEYVDHCKTHNHEQVPEECSDGSISIPSKQVEEQGKKILEILSLETQDHTLEFLRTIGEACSLFIQSLPLQRNCQLTVSTDCCMVLKKSVTLIFGFSIPRFRLACLPLIT
jgi:hypothetical protein